MSLLILLLFVGIIGNIEGQGFKCYQQNGSNETVKECGWDIFCHKKNCHGRVYRGCGQCTNGTECKNCQNCIGDLCNGGDIENLDLDQKCHAQLLHDDSVWQHACSDSLRKHDDFCYKENCQGWISRGCGKCRDGDGDDGFRDCGKCRPQPSCKCHECRGQLCNLALGIHANSNNLCGILAMMLFSSLIM